MNEIPSRCIDPVLKDCVNCCYGCRILPEWVETYEYIYSCCYVTVCRLGYDQGRPEDEPTDEELKKFDEWLKNLRLMK